MKGSIKGIKLKYLLFIFVTVLLPTLPVRVYQMFKIVEAKTGFYTTSSPTVPFLYGILGVFTAAVISLSYLSAEIPSPRLPTGKNKLLGVASAILGVGLLWSVTSDMITLLKNFASKSSLISGGYLSELFSQQGGIITPLRIAAAFLGAIYLFVFCVSHFDGKASYKDHKILALMPMFWAMCSLISCLMQEISYIRVSELMLDMCLYVFAMLFLMNYARVASVVANEGIMWQIFGFGAPAAVFGILAGVPRLMLLIMGRPLVTDYPFDLSSLAVAAFAVIYIFASLGIGFNRAQEEEEENGFEGTGVEEKDEPSVETEE